MSFPFFLNRNGSRKLSPFFRFLSSDVRKKYGQNIQTFQTSPPEYQSFKRSTPSSQQPKSEGQPSISSLFNNWTPGLSTKSDQHQILHPVPDWASLSLPPIVKTIYDSPVKPSPEEVKEFRQLLNIHLTQGFNKETKNPICDPIFNFKDLEWPTFITEAIKQERFESPTPIQAESWPILLKGHNLVGVAETGSGKTLSFALPALYHLIKQPDYGRNPNPKVLIIAPVRELAIQIGNEINKYARNSNIRAAVFYGGDSKSQQLFQLRSRPQIIVATPGRLIDIVNTRQLNLQNISFLVLDEADRLLDMGFAQPIHSIRQQIRPDRQMVMFTATWPKDVRELARDYMGTDFLQLTIGSEEMAAKTVHQHIEMCEDYEKAELLQIVLQQNREESQAKGLPFRALIFCNRKGMTERVASLFDRSDLRCAAFHGDVTQDQRQRILQNFRDGKINVLVASDAASRGLDVKNISIVVNYEFPNNIETYIHRIGRTGRAGTTGFAVSFLSWENQRLFSDLVQLLKRNNQPIPPELKNSVNQNPGGKSRQKGGLFF
jgi:ATP-dependent RNA helicase DDX5/DBP2